MAKKPDIGVMSKLRLLFDEFGKDVLPYGKINRKGMSNEKASQRVMNHDVCLDYAKASMIQSASKKQCDMLKRQMQSMDLLGDFDNLTPGVPHETYTSDEVSVFVQVNNDSDGDIDKVALDNQLRKDLDDKTYAKVAKIVKDNIKVRRGARTISVTLKEPK